MIYKLKPNRVHRTYKGGKRLNAFCGTSLAEEYMPEDWTASIISAYDASGNKEGIGQTEEGLFLVDIVEKENYKLLVKLLDSAERLVVQAHPTVPFAKEHLNSSFGKTECWYFLDCEEDAYVLIGFKKGVTRAEWEEVFKSQDAEKMLSMLHKVPVKKGDFIFVEGGMPHAIGPGCFMIELQEPSDLMVVAEKQTPSGRIIPDRRIDMGLPFDKMLDVYVYEGLSFEALKKRVMPQPKAIATGITEILGDDVTNMFKMLRCDGNCRLEIPEKYAVAVCVEGMGRINEKTISKGDRFLICEEEKISFKASKSLSVIICY